MALIDRTGNGNNLNKLYQQHKTGKVGAGRPNPYAKGTQQAPGVGKDGLELSQRSGEVNNIKGQFDQTPDVDREKVDRLRELVSTGAYTINTQQLAAKVLAIGARF